MKRSCSGSTQAQRASPYRALIRVECNPSFFVIFPFQTLAVLKWLTMALDSENPSATICQTQIEIETSLWLTWNLPHGAMSAPSLPIVRCVLLSKSSDIQRALELAQCGVGFVEKLAICDQQYWQGQDLANIGLFACSLLIASARCPLTGFGISPNVLPSNGTHPQNCALGSSFLTFHSIAFV